MNDKIEQLSKEYIILAFSLDAIVGKGNVVDSYVGNFDFSNDELVTDSNLLIKKINVLIESINNLSLNERNQQFLDLKSAVISFYHLAKNLINQTNNNYYQQIKNIYQTALQVPDDKEINKLKKSITSNLNKLGYNRKWPLCYEDWNKDNSVSGKEYFNILINCSDNLEELTFEKVILPILGNTEAKWLNNNSSVKYDLIDTKELWNAYHYYYKGFKSEVKINKNNSFNKHEAFFLAAHEIFPGHHTEAIIKEYFYKKGELGLSSTINVLSSPFSLISEGIADYGYYFFGKEYTTNQKITHGYRRLTKSVRHRLAIKIINGDISTEEGIDLLSKKIGINRKGAEKSIRFATEKWKLYFPCYYMGYQTVSNIFDQYGYKSIEPLYKYSALELIKPEISE